MREPAGDELALVKALCGRPARLERNARSGARAFAFPRAASRKKKTTGAETAPVVSIEGESGSDQFALALSAATRGAEARPSLMPCAKFFTLFKSLTRTSPSAVHFTLVFEELAPPAFSRM